MWKANLNKRTLLILAIFFQISILTVMVLNSYTILLRGEKILLKVEPVDPRSLFQGDYVRLDYSFSRLELTETNHDLDLDSIRPRDRVYLVFEPRGQAWEPVYVTQEKSKLANKVYITGQVLYLNMPISLEYRKEPGREEPLPEPERPFLQLKLGIETYFVPEGQGREIEDKIRDGLVYAQVAVYHGRARVADLISQ